MTRILFGHVAMISDLHVGDPSSPQLDDFRLDQAFENLLLDVIPKRSGARTTLVIAGDFIDFAQTMPEFGMHAHGEQFGVTEAESLQKLQAVATGHPTVFDAMKQFLGLGNQILILPGNHDIDFHWNSVFGWLRERLGNGFDTSLLQFVNDAVIEERGLYIEHGNQYAFDNRFDHWTQPILPCPPGPPRIERPWGTMFMDLVYSDLKQVYPFINKFWPHSALAMIALRSCADERRIKLSALARLLAFLVTKGKRFLVGVLMGGESVATAGDVLESVLDSLQLDNERRTELRNATLELVARRDAMDVPADRGLMGQTDENGIEARAMQLLRANAASIVAFGHTHHAIDGNVAPKWGDGDPRRLFNTGSWVPHIDIGAEANLRVDDLVRWSTDATRLTVAPRFLHIDLGATPTAQLLAVPV